MFKYFVVRSRTHFFHIISHIYYLLVLISIGCTRLEHISFNVKTPGIKNGVFILKNDTGGMAYSANIKNSILKLDSQIIQQNGYYTLQLTNSDIKDTGTQYEVYLQPGHYYITFDTVRAIYPQIKSPSAIQQELSAFYLIKTNLEYKRKKIYLGFDNYLNSKRSNGISQAAFAVLAKNTTVSGNILRNTELDAFRQFIKQYPKSVIAAHLMAEADYHQDPAAYEMLFRGLSAETRNSEDGKSVRAKISALVKLLPGHLAPNITGTTPDGKAFNPADFKSKKLYLVEIWKSANMASRENHSQVSMLNLLAGISDKKALGMIGISVDHKKEWWTSAIKDDKISCPQYSDLKGNESANTLNWGITTLPTYYLIDNTWHIVAKDIVWGQEVQVNVNAYLKHH